MTTTDKDTVEARARTKGLSVEEAQQYQLLRDAVIAAAKEWKRMSHTRTRLSRHSKNKLMEAVGDLCAFERHFLDTERTS